MIKKTEKYIKLSCKQVITANKYGLELYDNGDWHTIEIFPDRRRVIIVFRTYFDYLLFRLYRASESKRHSRNRIKENESREGYEAVLAVLQRNIAERQEEARKYHEKAQRMMNESISNYSNDLAKITRFSNEITALDAEKINEYITEGGENELF